MSPGDIRIRFTYHKPSELKARTREDVRTIIMDLAFDLDGLLPEGREKSLSITKLEEVMFWANAAIAREPVAG